MFDRLGKWLRHKNVFAVVGVALGGGLAAGLIAWGGFNVTTEVLTSNAFCTSCHEMARQKTSYEASVHFRNVFGVRAQCSDCHVPKPFFRRVVHMTLAVRDVIGHFTGIIDTPKKFEAHRRVMAERVWNDMRASDSIGCRSCHAFEAMAFDQQPVEASTKMHQAMKEGKTCIDCHRGIVHPLPEGASPTEDRVPGIPGGTTPGAPGAAPSGSGLISSLPPTGESKPKLAAGDTDYAGTKAPLTTDADGKAFGSVTPGTPLRIVGHTGDRAEVRIDGWSMTGAEQIVFAAKGQRIALAHLSATDVPNRKVTERGKDIYGIDWQHVVVTGWVPTGDLVGDVSVVWQVADALYKKRCTACHALHQPREFTANQWPHILKIMEKRAGFTPTQAALVTQFIQTHAAKQRETATEGRQSASRSRR